MGYIAIIRPVNCLITSFAVIVGAWAGQERRLTPPILLAALAGFLICAFGNVVNDLRDIEIDRRNNPRRPLVTGRAGRGAAVVMAAALPVLGLALVWPAGRSAVAVVACALTALFFYAFFLKKTVIGNLVVAVTAALAFFLGGITTGNRLWFVPFSFAVIIHLAREIIKDVIDIEGDRAGRVYSLPIVIGSSRALAVSALALGLLCLMIPVPYVLRIFNVAYIILVAVGSYPLLGFVIVRLLQAPSLKELQLISVLLKITMGVGLFGFVLG